MPMTTTNIENMYTREQAAKRLGMSRATLDRKRYAGEIEEVQLGPRKIRITEDAIAQYIQTHTKHCVSFGSAQAS